MATLLTLKDTSLLLSRSALFPTRATKAPGLACWVNSSTNSFASSNERLCVMSYTTIAVSPGRNNFEPEVSCILSVTVMLGSSLTFLKWVHTKRTNKHELRLRSLNLKKNHLIAFMLIVKRFLTFARSFEIIIISIIISVQQVRFAHSGPSCFITEAKKKKLKNLNKIYNDFCIFDIYFEIWWRVQRPAIELHT